MAFHWGPQEVRLEAERLFLPFLLPRAVFALWSRLWGGINADCNNAYVYALYTGPTFFSPSKSPCDLSLSLAVVVPQCAGPAVLWISTASVGPLMLCSTEDMGNASTYCVKADAWNAKGHAWVCSRLVASTIQPSCCFKTFSKYRDVQFQALFIIYIKFFSYIVFIISWYMHT